MAKNTKPAIRFKGFTDAWEQRKLSSLCEKFTDGDWIEAKDQSDSGVRLIQTGNVGVTEYLDKPNNKKWVTADTFERLRCEEVLPGDILISRLPEPAGRACIMPNLGTKMITAVDCTIVRTFAEYSSKFLVQFLSTHDYFNEVNTALAGGTRQRISRSNLASFDVPTPPTFEEQEAIGNYFKHLDHLITLHQRKYDSLVNVKKAMLEKMFPKNGETVPEIRFKGFTDAWEQRKLVNDLKSIQTGTNKLGSTENTGMPLLKMGNIQRGYFSLDKLEYLDENDVVEPENIAYKGDFFFNTRNTLDLVGKGATWTGDSGKYAFNSNIARFDLGELDTIFFNYLYNTGSIQKQVHARAMGTTSVAAIYPRTLDSITYCIPCKEEQLKIGYCLKNIDDLITLHQRKLEKLKNIKKSCLEKMFV